MVASGAFPVLVYNTPITTEHRKRINDMTNKTNWIILSRMRLHSSRAWVYREGQGWVFAELTPDELAEFRSYEYALSMGLSALAFLIRFSVIRPSTSLSSGQSASQAHRSLFLVPDNRTRLAHTILGSSWERKEFLCIGYERFSPVCMFQQRGW